MKQKNILVLGAQGMLGHVVYNYLSEKFPGTVWGTAKRKNKNLLSFKVESFDKDLAKIINNFNKIDYVINCIALLESKSKADFKKINSNFPLQLAEILQKNNTQLIHVSTDAVFGKNSGVVNEKNMPSPDDEYGKSKLAGESSLNNCFNIRTSLLGFDKRHHKGLLEWGLKENALQGYTNQLWSGCTTLQLAQLLEQIITKNLFTKLRNKTSVLHFAPLSNLSKNEILTNLNLTLKTKKQIKGVESQTKINRQLKTLYGKEIALNSFIGEVKPALQELISFERIHI